MACWEEITLGKPDMDEKIEAWIRLLECLGQAGIPTLGWNFKPMGNFRTTPEIGRGGVKYSSFDYEEFKQNRPDLPRPLPPKDGDYLKECFCLALLDPERP